MSCTSGMPTASAERRIALTLCGSWMSSRTTVRSGCRERRTARNFSRRRSVMGSFAVGDGNGAGLLHLEDRDGGDDEERPRGLKPRERLAEDDRRGKDRHDRLEGRGDDRARGRQVADPAEIERVRNEDRDHGKTEELRPELRRDVRRGDRPRGIDEEPEERGEEERPDERRPDAVVAQEPAEPDVRERPAAGGRDPRQQSDAADRHDGEIATRDREKTARQG